VEIIRLIRQQAEIRPSHIALHCFGAGGPLTYGELIQQVERVAAWLESRGCQPADRCGLIVEEGPDFLINALGILAAGLCLAPIGLFLPQGDHDFIIGSAGLHWLLQGKSQLVRFPFASPVDAHTDQDYRAVSPAYIRFTSGTTGARKGVLLGHPTIIDRLNAADTVLKIRPEDRVWFTLPMADHFVVSILLYLSRGATVITTREGQPESWRELVREAKPGLIYGAPDFYEQLVGSPVEELPGVRLAISTASLLAPKTQEAFSRRFGKPLSPALGIIEAGLLTIDFQADQAGSVGTPLPSYKVAILNEDGTPVMPGEAGQLYVQGPGLLDAYLAPWRPRSDLLKRYGYPTGDFARQDENGFLFLAGRGKNRLRVNGLSFFCEEIESILNTMPGILESRVFIDHGQLAAEIVGTTESIQTLPQLLRGKVDPRKVPSVFLRVDRLPRTANGKLLRH
jgi:long-chain acyl-CoA synthetase